MNMIHYSDGRPGGTFRTSAFPHHHILKALKTIYISPVYFRNRPNQEITSSDWLFSCFGRLSWETSKQPIRTRYLGNVNGYQPIMDQYFLIWSEYYEDSTHGFMILVDVLGRLISVFGAASTTFGQVILQTQQSQTKKQTTRPPRSAETMDKIFNFYESQGTRLIAASKMRKNIRNRPKQANNQSELVIQVT
eukprot:sb/3471082/